MEWVDKYLNKMDGTIAPEDMVATLTRLTADTIADGLLAVSGGQNASLYVSGGGAHNQVIMAHLRARLQGWTIDTVDSLGVSGDAKEAVLFALLANETIAGETEGGATLGGVPLVSMGKISLPD
jgi:anhydro-N-acetylmuramic acid kinase